MRTEVMKSYKSYRSYMTYASILVMASGCRGGSPNLMPLRAGAEWKYSIVGEFGKHVEELRVNREIGVAGTQGFEVSGPLGVSALAWKNDVLYADRLAGTSFSPPLPLLSQENKTLDWKGTATWPVSGAIKAEASLQQEDEKLTVDAREFQTKKALLRVALADGTTVEVTTWYSAGVGIVRQEQRRGEKTEVRMDYLSGP